MPVPTGIAQKDADLAILDASRRPGVLACDTNRFGPLLQKPGLVNDQDRVRIAQVLHHIGAQIIAHRLRIPARRAQQPLHPVRAALPHGLGQLPAVAPLDRVQQAG
jgi:hypothetical protein